MDLRDQFTRLGSVKSIKATSVGTLADHRTHVAIRSQYWGSAWGPGSLVGWAQIQTAKFGIVLSRVALATGVASPHTIARGSSTFVRLL